MPTSEIGQDLGALTTRLLLLLLCDNAHNFNRMKTSERSLSSNENLSPRPPVNTSMIFLNELINYTYYSFAGLIIFKSRNAIRRNGRICCV